MRFELEITTGEAFDQLFFALTEQRDRNLKCAIKSIGTGEKVLENFVMAMADVETVDSLIADLVTGLNESAYSHEAEYTPHIKEGRDRLGQYYIERKMQEWAPVIESVRKNIESSGRNE